MNASFKRSNSARHKSRGAFTLVELLVVLAVLAVLASLTLPALTRAQGQSRQAQCAANLRQLTLAQLTYGAENQDRLPTSSAGSWLWDVPPVICDALQKYGASRQQFYCPANPDQNVNGLWNFSSSYRVTGYSCTFPGTAALVSSNANFFITPQQFVFASTFLQGQPAAQRPLVADVVISQFGQNNTAQKLNYQYASIAGGFPTPHRTSHLDFQARYPSGANVGMLDGHVEWRTFSNVVCRTTGGAPGFWW